MVKADDDVRQEVFCMHMISLFQARTHTVLLVHMQGTCRAHAHAPRRPRPPRTCTQDIFRREKLEKLANGLRTYTIQSTSSQTGLVEVRTETP